MLEYVRVVGVKRRRLYCLEVCPPPPPSLLGSTGLCEVLLSQDTSSHLSLPHRLPSQRQI